ncbi:MAG: hypothetical protein ACKVWR_17625 [Acidimicrobiales bacterium]
MAALRLADLALGDLLLLAGDDGAARLVQWVEHGRFDRAAVWAGGGRLWAPDAAAGPLEAVEALAAWDPQLVVVRRLSEPAPLGPLEGEALDPRQALGPILVSRRLPGWSRELEDVVRWSAHQALRVTGPARPGAALVADALHLAVPPPPAGPNLCGWALGWPLADPVTVFGAVGAEWAAVRQAGRGEGGIFWEAAEQARWLHRSQTRGFTAGAYGPEQSRWRTLAESVTALCGRLDPAMPPPSAALLAHAPGLDTLGELRPG